MSRIPAHHPATEARQRGRIVFLGLLVAMALVCWAIAPRSRTAGHRTGVKNAEPATSRGVQYVGDEACARCHAEIAATFRQHSMGRSLAPVDQARLGVNDEAGARDLFESQGSVFSVERRDGRMIHRQTRRDRHGRIIAQAEGEVRYVLGSGSRGLSFLIDRDGYLFQSPITWYAQKRRWDLAPGYENRTERFERPINPECLFCHANRVEHVPGTDSRYRPPTFRGYAIGCERCHGPGERHVQAPIVSTEAEPTIINPAKLAPALREDVCQQCHLIGTQRVAPADHDLFDYRPGLPLYQFLTVFVRPPGLDQEHRNGDQVEQMYQSRCFRASGGALGCISCHDPHKLPPNGEKIAYYRERCLRCHDDLACRVPLATRQAQSPANNCIGCHMPPAPITDISHTSMTIHSIPRHRDGGETTSSGGIPPRFDEALLIPFHGDRMTSEEREATRRDLALVLGELKGGRGAAKAIPLLEEALAARPTDIHAREALGIALGAIRGREPEGSAALEAALGMAPDRESTLVAAALLAGRQQRHEQAIGYFRRATAIDPWRSFYHAALAHHLARSGQWEEAEESSRHALRINPLNVLSRTILIESLFRKGAPQQARAELDTLLEFDPPDRAELIRWFDSLR
jgi:tetratricopeptide (TPR) repeat protein